MSVSVVILFDDVGFEKPHRRVGEGVSTHSTSWSAVGVREKFFFVFNCNHVLMMKSLTDHNTFQV